MVRSDIPEKKKMTLAHRQNLDCLIEGLAELATGIHQNNLRHGNLAFGNILVDMHGQKRELEKIHTFAVARDITEWKQNEEALKESKLLIDATGRVAKVGGWEFPYLLDIHWYLIYKETLMNKLIERGELF